MANQVDKKFTWVISNFSSLKSKSFHSNVFIRGGCKWRLRVIPCERVEFSYYYMHLEGVGYKSLPAGSRRLARFSVTIVNQNPEKSFKGDDTQSWFDRCSYLCPSQPLLAYCKLKSKDGGFLVNDELKIVAEVEVLEVVGKLDVTEEPEAATRPRKKTKLNDDGAVSSDMLKPAINVYGAEVEAVGKLDVTDEPEAATPPLKKTKLNDDGAVSRDMLKPAINVYGAEVEVLEAVGKLDATDEPEAATRPRKKTKLNDDGAVSRDMLKGTINVYGFHVLPSQVDAVRHIFKKHPDVALGFRAKIPILKASCMNFLLSLTEILRKLPREISRYDLASAYSFLGSLKGSGFKVDWLEKKLNEVSEKKEKGKAFKTRMQEIQKEWREVKAKALAAEAPVTLDDVV